MSGDYSRMSFDPARDFCGVLMQQGKVQLDSDWNEWVAIVERRLRAGTMDTIGRAAVPRTTADGFRIQAVGGALEILPGRIYVDGILAENHGSGAAAWEEHLAELRRPGPLTYAAQPYLPNPPALPAGGPHVVYIDVWARELTHLQQPDLVEKAVGIDTTTRLQTVWQVKLWPNAGNAVTCATPLTDLEGWNDANGPSGGRLTTAPQNNPGPDNPCLAPPTAGYTGLENQLYRVEIHTPGGAGPARFKWSRDNGSVAARVLSITGNTRLVVDSVGKDALLRFSDGDWVEITDDWRELAGLPGEVRRIKLGGGVDDATRTIVLDQALTAGLFPVDALNNTQPARHTRIQRWDQKGKVLRADGTVFIDLDAAGADGLIPVPPAGTPLVLEQGVLVQFSVAAGGAFKRLDYWTFAARTADASVEVLDHAPPRGIHHHYAKLAIVTFPDAETDCRTLWPPLLEGGDNCACTVCVRAEDHNAGTATIQQAIDAVAPAGGTVCLEPGTYQVREPLTIAGCRGVRLRGQGVATVLIGGESGNVVRVLGAQCIAIEDLALVGSGRGDAAHLIAVENVLDLELHRLYALSLGGAEGAGGVVALSGIALGVEITDCVLFGAQGIGFAARESQFFFGAGLLIDDNLLIALRRGVWFDGFALFAGAVAVTSNTVLGAREAAIVLGGASLEAADVLIACNRLYVRGVGIAAGVNDVNVEANVYGGLAGGSGDGVRLQPGLLPSGLRRAAVTGNRLLDCGDAGVRATAPVAAAIVADNFIERAGTAGISFDAGAPSGNLSIARNHLMDIVLEDLEGAVSAGIRVVRATRAEIHGNMVSNVARRGARARAVAGIGVLAVDELRLGENHLSGIAARDGFIGTADGLLVIGPAVDAEVGGNSVRRRADEDAKMGDGRWCGIRLPWFNEKLETVFLMKSAAVVFLDGASVVFLGDRVLTVAQAARNATVRGNRVQGQDSRIPYVLIENMRSAIFAENQVEVGPGAPLQPIAQLRRGSFTAQANVLRSQRELVTLRIDHTESSLAIGNLSTGPIWMNGAPLAPPLDVLNLIIA